jgi:hypothetical protein
MKISATIGLIFPIPGTENYFQIAKYRFKSWADFHEMFSNFVKGFQTLFKKHSALLV